MTLHGLRRDADARREFNTACGQTDRTLKRKVAPFGEKLSWTWRLTLTLLRAEAEALLRQKEQPTRQSAEESGNRKT
jgi:hypothetical protein